MIAEKGIPMTNEEESGRNTDFFRGRNVNFANMSLEQISKIILGCIICITVLLGYQLQQLRFSYDMEDFFPINSEDTQFFEQFRQNFGNDDDFVLVGIQHHQGIFQHDFLQQIDSLTKRIAALPNIESVQSLTNIKELRRSGMYYKLLEVPYLHFDRPEKYAEDSIRIYESPLLVDFLVSSDAKSVLLYVKNADLLGDTECRILTKDLERTFEDFSFEEYHIAGRCTGQTVYVDMIQREVRVFIGFAILAIVLFLWLTYRSFWGVLLPLLVVGLTVLWTMGIMVLNGKSVDLISNVIPTILMIIGIADVIHLLTDYEHRQAENRAKGFPKSATDILQTTVKEVGMATLLTTFTTAIGFLTLTTSRFKPLVDLGWYATIGLLIALLLTYTLVPSVLVLIEGKFQIKAQKLNPISALNAQKLHLGKGKMNLQNLFDWTMGHSKQIVLVSAMVCVAAIWGASQIKVNIYILEDLKEEHPQQKGFAFFEEHFGGVRSFELAMNTKDTSKHIFDFEVLQEIALVDSFLTEQYGVKNLISPVVVMKTANQIYHQGRKDYYRMPENPKETGQISKRLQQYADDIQLNKLVDASKNKAHISGKIPDWGSHLVGQKNEALDLFITRELGESQLEYRVTGTAYLMDLNNSFLAENVLKGLVIAIVIIGILFGWLLQSFRMIFLALIPNLLPLLFVAGIMGFAGIDLKISTAIIFIVAFGIAVDDSIHFLSRFRREICSHKVEAAVRETYLHTGKAIIVTSLILAVGFLTLCSSDFLGTFYIGLLIAVTLLVALLADLLLLPVLLVWFYRHYRKGES
ncbi:MAG: MMPL family transporter [Chitinophagales bacterium]